MDAKNERFDGPDGRDDLMFTDGDVGASISCRTIVRTLRSDTFDLLSLVRLVRRIPGVRECETGTSDGLPIFRESLE